jgi:hypothetical protein
MNTTDALYLLENEDAMERIKAALASPEYEGKRVIFSANDLTGQETDEELNNIVALYELAFG